MDEGKIISLRMGTEELQTMDDYLQQHPEMGGRSLFIRSAIRAYVDRDADVAQTHKNEVAVRLANAEIDTIDSMVEDGIYIDRSDDTREDRKHTAYNRTCTEQIHCSLITDKIKV